MAVDELVTLLVRLVRNPADDEARRRVAEALDRQGLTDDAIGVLAPFVNLTGHEDTPTLPCLCKTCVARAGSTAETAGVKFHRSFAVAKNRVLQFWLADELATQRGEVRRAVGEALRLRVARKRKRKQST
ncbi:MAG: hypothetical protein IPQ07_23825 [Myxococcales bacterium]|nr:hypothetical protein [Myxococcales bacterium]